MDANKVGNIGRYLNVGLKVYNHLILSLQLSLTVSLRAPF